MRDTKHYSRYVRINSNNAIFTPSTDIDKPLKKEQHLFMLLTTLLSTIALTVIIALWIMNINFAT